MGLLGKTQHLRKPPYVGLDEKHDAIISLHSA